MATNHASTPILADCSIEPMYFTLEQADRSLVYIGKVVQDIRETYASIIDLRKQLEVVGQHRDTDGQLERGYERAMDRLSELVDELHTAGVELKDFEKGMIDFPAIYQNREVLLCWKAGEAQVGFWHETDESCMERRPVALLTNTVGKAKARAA